MKLIHILKGNLGHSGIQHIVARQCFSSFMQDQQKSYFHSTPHHRASLILLYFYTTSRAGSHIILAHIELVACFLSTLTFMSLLPFVMTFEACYLIAVRASQLVALTIPLNLFLALEIRTPYHVWITINLDCQLHLLKLLFISLAQLL